MYMYTVQQLYSVDCRGVACGGGMGGGTCPPPSPRWGGTGGAPTGGRLLYKTALRFNRLEVNVLYEVY